MSGIQSSFTTNERTPPGAEEWRTLLKKRRGNLRFPSAKLKQTTSLKYACVPGKRALCIPEDRRTLPPPEHAHYQSAEERRHPSWCPRCYATQKTHESINLMNLKLPIECNKIRFNIQRTETWWYLAIEQKITHFSMLRRKRNMIDRPLSLPMSHHQCVRDVIGTCIDLPYRYCVRNCI